MPSPTVAARRDPPDGYEELLREAGTFYHEPAWIDGLGRLFRFPTYYVAVQGETGLDGVLPLCAVPALLGRARLVSLPFSYAAGPLARSAAATERLYDGARDLARRSGTTRVEIKRVAATGDAPPGFARVSRYATYKVPMRGGIDEVWHRLHQSSTQRGIRKSRRTGLVVERPDGAAAWREMAELQTLTSHRLGLPAPPDAFFVGLCRDLQERGLAQLYLARLPTGGSAAGIVCWKGRREWIYAFGASRPEHLELRPNHALLWAAMTDAAAAGVDFDLGRAAPEQKGLVEFKVRWGGEAVPLTYDYWPDAGGLNVRPRDTGRLALLNKVWSALPAPVARRGSFLYRYLG
ncbi:MAG: GNAT family N-acetyltransferase [Gemmatimonadaceae bacterium]